MNYDDDDEMCVLCLPKTNKQTKKTCRRMRKKKSLSDEKIVFSEKKER